MGEVLDLAVKRRRRSAGDAFGRWERRMGYAPQPDETLAQMPDLTLAKLAELDSPATLALYDVVMGVRGWGSGDGFLYLESPRKVEALDAFLVLADQVRFEVLRRLGWVEDFPGAFLPLQEVAFRPLEAGANLAEGTPRLIPACPHYEQVAERLAYEPAAVVRSLIPAALREFREGLVD